MGDPLLDAVIGGVLGYLLGVLLLAAAVRWAFALMHGPAEVAVSND